MRARRAVSHFAVGSAARSPGVRLLPCLTPQGRASRGAACAKAHDVRSVHPGQVRLGGPGLYACGDWVDRTGHASWSTEKAVVTGRQAAAAVAADLKLSGVDSAVPISPYISLCLTVSPCISLRLPISCYISWLFPSS